MKLKNITAPIAILNTSILTSIGSYSLETITLAQAQEIVKNNALDSAVGHQSTAESNDRAVRS